MKIILLPDVAKIGRKGSLVEVPDGYARNQLIPSKSAEAATPQNIKKHQHMIANKEADKIASVEKFNALKKQLQEVEISIKADANEKDHLFKAVSKEDVVEAAKAAGVSLNQADIVFPEVIKSLGEHQVSLQHGGDQGSFTITVIKK